MGAPAIPPLAPSAVSKMLTWDRNGIVKLGNSRLASEYRLPIHTGYTRRNGWNFLTQANRYLGQRLRDKGNFAVTGLSSAQYLSKTPGAVAGTDYSWLAFDRGHTNNVDAAFATDAYWGLFGDIVNDMALAETAQAGSAYNVDFWTVFMKPVVLKWISQGRKAILSTEYGAENLTGKPAVYDAMSRYNAQVRAFCRENGGAVLFDAAQLVLDQTVTTGIAFKAGMSGEPANQKVHVNLVEGAMKLGKAFADLMAPLVPPVSGLVNSHIESRTTTNNNSQFFKNPLFLNTANNTISADHSGTRPDGVTAFAGRNPGGASTGGLFTAESSIQPGAYGNDWKISAKPFGPGWVEFIGDYGDINAEVEGDIFYGNCEYDILVANNLQGVELHIEHGRTGTATPFCSSDGYIDGAGNGALTTKPVGHVIQTPEMRIRAGARSTNLLWRLKIYFSAAHATASEILIRRMGLWRKPSS